MTAWTLHRPNQHRSAKAALAANKTDGGIAPSTSRARENTVPRSHVPPAKTPVVPSAWLNDDKIEQRIVRAFVHLTLDSTERTGSRVVTVARAGFVEARLSEIPAPGKDLGLPQFWLEIYSHATRTVIGSRGCYDFNERELAAAVKMVSNALDRNRLVH